MRSSGNEGKVAASDKRGTKLNQLRSHQDKTEWETPPVTVIFIPNHMVPIAMTLGQANGWCPPREENPTLFCYVIM